MNVLVFMVVVLSISAARADDNPVNEHLGSMLSFQTENDSAKIGGPGTDQAYTAGLKISYGYADDHVPSWARIYKGVSRVLSDEIDGSKTNYIISVAQKLYTPQNLQDPAPQPDDQPYAAWLYAGFGINLKNGDHGHSVELDVGTVGPNAQGEPVQNNIHNLIGEQTAKGWGNQIHNEPTLELSYQFRSRWMKIANSSGDYFDMIPYLGFAAGNVLDAAQAGGLFRIGYHLPDDLGPSRFSTLGSDAYINPRWIDRKHDKFSIYAFWGLSGSGVAHNIFLDGNTFESSPHVTRIPFVYDIEEGVAARLYSWYLAWKFITRSPEFTEKREFTSFASLQITYTFAD